MVFAAASGVLSHLVDFMAEQLLGFFDTSLKIAHGMDRG